MMLNVGSPEQAFSAAMLPTTAWGLARMEFIFASWVKVHPLALTGTRSCRRGAAESTRSREAMPTSGVLRRQAFARPA